MKHTNVVEVKIAPTLRNPEIVSGFRDKLAAKAWGEKHGHATVYYLAKKQRVYVERLLTHVDEVAGNIEQASADLLAMAKGAAA